MHLNGIEYFPLKTYDSTELEMLKSKFGCEATEIYIELMKRIYRDKGYYMEMGQDEMAFFASCVRIELSKVNAIINECLNRGIFDKSMYDNFQILTSESIQSIYFFAVKKRKGLVLVEEYLFNEGLQICKKQNQETEKDVSNAGKKLNQTKMEQEMNGKMWITQSETKNEQKTNDKMWITQNENVNMGQKNDKNEYDSCDCAKINNNIINQKKEKENKEKDRIERKENASYPQPSGSITVETDDEQPFTFNRQKNLSIECNNLQSTNKNLVTRINNCTIRAITNDELERFAQEYPSKKDYKIKYVPVNFNLEQLLSIMKKSCFLQYTNEVTLKWLVINYDKVLSEKYNDYKSVCDYEENEEGKQRVLQLIATQICHPIARANKI